MYVVCPHWAPEPEIFENLFSKLLILQKQSSVRVVPEPLLNNVGIVHLEGEKNWRGLLRLSISPFSFFAYYLFVMGWRRPHFRPSGLSRSHGINLKLVHVAVFCCFFFFSFATADVCRKDFFFFHRSQNNKDRFMSCFSYRPVFF